MRTLALLIPLAVAAALAGASAPAAMRATSTGRTSPVVTVRPSIVRLRQQASLSVSNLPARSLQVRLAGGTSASGELLPWRSLRLVHGVWHGSLPAPSLRGVYPILLRRGQATRPVTLAFRLRVFAAGTRARPAFTNPVDVARWWVRTVPRGTVVAVKQWRRPAFDRRDPRLHRLFVVAYSPPGMPRISDRLGMFVTAFRDGYHAQWQFLEATVAP